MENKSNLSIPIAIVVAGVIVAVAIVYSVGKFATPGAPPGEEELSGSLEMLRPVGADDHIRGDLNAPVKIVVYADWECPFCKRFHETMQEVVKQYGGNKVAWVQRHFPLQELHPKAFNEAIATECAAKIGGPNAFWSYLDKLFEITPSNNQLDPAELPRIADQIGLDRVKFAECMENNTFATDLINKDIENAVATGGNGTPWSILVAPDGTKYPINGAQPIEAVKQIIELVLKQ